MIKQKHITYLILIFAAVIALFLYNPWLLYFQNDDMVHIPLSRDGVLFQRNSFRLICDLSMILDYRLWDKQAWGYHLTNLLLHIINSVSVFIVTKLFVRKYLSDIEENLTAFTTAVLFWIYMNHSEAVFWILGRSAMVGMLFFLPAIIFYFYRRSGFNFLLSIIFCLLAWLSYESTLILPVVFFLISLVDIKSQTSAWKAERRFLFVYIIAFIIYCCCRFHFMGLNANYYNAGSIGNVGLAFIAGSFFRLAIRSWLPPIQNKIILITVFIVVIALITYFFIRIKQNRIKNTLLILISLWCISLLPYLTFSIDTKGVESERFLYLPSFFICIILSVCLVQFTSGWRILLIILISFLNIIVLAHHAKQYSFAGSVVAATIKAVNNLKNKKILYAYNVPQENFGALIFRSGFTEGINWLKNKNTIDSVIVLSQADHDLPLQKNYPVKYSNDISLVKKSTIRKHFTANDVYFLYTDSCLYTIDAH